LRLAVAVLVSRGAAGQWFAQAYKFKNHLEIGETVVNAKEGGIIVFGLLFCFLGVVGLVRAVSLEHPLQGLLVLLSLTSFTVAWGITRIDKN
jgi:hypothetical protein